MGRAKAGAKPACESETKFRVHRYAVGLTWSCPRDKDENPIFTAFKGEDPKAALWRIREVFEERWGKSDFIVAEELHESGTRHYHAHFKCYEKIDTTDPRVFDMEGVHPNILAPGKGWPGYCAKHGNYVSNFYEAEAFAQAMQMDNVEDAVEHLWKKKPREMCIHGANIMSNVRKRLGSSHVAKAKFSLAFMCESIRQVPIEWEHEDWEHVVVLQGNPGCGKTEWALAHFAKPLLVTHLDGFRYFNPAVHDGIVADDVSFAHMPIETQIQVADWTQDRDIHGRNVCAFLPRHTRKIFTCNWGRYPFSRDEAIDSRVCHIELDRDLPCHRKRPPPRRAWPVPEADEEQPRLCNGLTLNAQAS